MALRGSLLKGGQGRSFCRSDIGEELGRDSGHREKLEAWWWE